MIILSAHAQCKTVEGYAILSGFKVDLGGYEYQWTAGGTSQILFSESDKVTISIEKKGPRALIVVEVVDTRFCCDKCGRGLVGNHCPVC